MNALKSFFSFQDSGKKRTLLVWVISFVFFGPISGFSNDIHADNKLPFAEDFTQDSRLAQKSEKPILVFFSSESCPYCEIVRDLYLQPMFEGKEGASQIIMREVSVDGIDYLKNFAGVKMDQQAFADQEGAYVTPVIRFYSPSGEPLTPDLIGYSSPDFYLAFLERAIESARKKMSKQSATLSADN